MNYIKKDYHLLIGLSLILISASMYLFETALHEPSNEIFTVTFFIHYGLSITYFVVLWKTHGKKFFALFGRNTLSSHTLLLVLFNISAYSLNKSLPVFNESVGWLCVFLVLESIILIGLSIFQKIPRWILVCCSFFLGIALLFNFYQALMVLPNFAVGFIGFFLLGISLLIFVPFYFLYGIIAILRSFTWSRAHTISLVSGIVVTLSITITYIVKWKEIEHMLDKSALTIDDPFSENELPDWIAVAQQTHSNLFFESYLKAGLVYQKFTGYQDGFFSFGNTGFSEGRLHDPLVSISSVFANRSILDNKTKIRILNYMYDARHQSGERFWSGENLASSRIVTNVELFPSHRLSYTEMIITVANNRPNNGRRWRNQQEAFFTFQLPEGGVVTSLSLWIGGEEEKAILTSKKKAQKAYNTIVGRERRDPSVVYWMEGNQVRVRVFPCTPAENRKFKIGVTTPLKFINDRLKYESITFQGPDHSHAKAAINIVSHEAKIIYSSFDLNSSLNSRGWKGDYKPDWFMDLQVEPIDKSVFTFLGESFSASSSLSTKTNFDPQTIYLDLSSNWTREEMLRVGELAGNRKIMALSNGLNKVSSAKLFTVNPAELPYFTMFPFYKINSSDNILVITKGGRKTPNLSDLEDSRFKKKLFSFFHNHSSPIQVIDLETAPTDYMRALRELNVIDYHHASLEMLGTFLRKRKFPTNQTDSSVVDIPLSGISIVQSDSENICAAPDHLMRLFYYQKVMNAIGKNYFAESKDDYIEDSLVAMAAKANVVTPLSSLIVLETQQDYDRFGIKQNKDSLGNATINNSGAVPEPHEWAMIIIGLFLIMYLYLKSRKTLVHI